MVITLLQFTRRIYLGRQRTVSCFGIDEPPSRKQWDGSAFRVLFLALREEQRSFGHEGRSSVEFWTWRTMNGDQ
jgi:hypothetical protein